MKVWDWYQERGLNFVSKRATRLIHRYGLSPAKVQNRISDCLAFLLKQGCAPTFFLPGILAERYPNFIRHLQEEGAEIGVHGYQHVNLNAFPLKEARRQLERADRAFERLGIHAHGFRGPYLNCCDELIDSLSVGLFNYSSNIAIRWGSFNDAASQRSKFYTTVEKIYQASDSMEMVCVPWNRSNLVEIPICLPDDLQLLDGLRLDVGGMTLAWQQMFRLIYQRGELFSLLFHTELASQCEQPLVDLLCEARKYQPPVWIARLYEISDWWDEKSTFKVEVIPNTDGLMLNFSCTPRATILVRGLGSLGAERLWDSAYYQLHAKILMIPAGPRPFVGLQDNAPEHVVSFLQDQGYIVETGEMASYCGTFINSATLSRLSSQVQLIDYIESRSSPLIRYGRWPDGAKSALSISGDLDALSLRDYVSRLFVA